MTDHRHGIIVAVTLASILCGCLEDDPVDCPPVQATFELGISAGGSPIPLATEMVVVYGAGQETHLLGSSVRGPVVFCDWVSMSSDGVVELDAGLVSQSLRYDSSELHCELWTTGPAHLQLTAPGYEPVAIDLRPEQDACGVVTHHEDIELVSSSDSLAP